MLKKREIGLDFAAGGVYNGGEEKMRRSTIMLADCAGEEVPLLHLLPIMHRIVRLTDAHKQYGLTKSQALVLIALCYRPSVTMSGIAQYLSSSKEQATRAVAGLFEHGLVERFELPENRTHVYIRMTEAGHEFMQQFRQQLQTEITKRLEESLTAEEIETLRGSVQTSVELLSKVK